MEPNLGIEVLANLKGCPTDIPFFFENAATLPFHPCLDFSLSTGMSGMRLMGWSPTTTSVSMRTPMPSSST